MTMPFSEYAAIPAINASAITAGQTSMMHMHHAMTGGERADTPAMSWGRKVHAAILEPERFFRDLAVWEGARRAGKDWTAFLADHPDTDTHVTRDQLAALQAMNAAVYGIEEARSMLVGSQAERVVTWDDPVCGAAKARIDIYAKRPGGAIIADLKTTRTIEPRAFMRSAYNMAYHVRMGWCARGCRAAGLDWPTVYLIVVESSAPYDAWACRIPDAIVRDGETDAVEIATHYNVCRQLGRYPGASQSVIDYELPAYATGIETDISEGTMEGGEL